MESPNDHRNSIAETSLPLESPRANWAYRWGLTPPFSGSVLGAKPGRRSIGHEAHVRGHLGTKAFSGIRIGLGTDRSPRLNGPTAIHPNGFNEAQFAHGAGCENDRFL